MRLDLTSAYRMVSEMSGPRPNTVGGQPVAGVLVAARFERCDAGMPRALCVKRSIEPISLSSFRALIAPATGSWGSRLTHGTSNDSLIL